MAKSKKITIWSKYCVRCLWYDDYMAIVNYAQHEGIGVKVRRTVYRPDWHWRATKLYGSDDYDVFVVRGKKVENFMEFAKKCRNKLVKAGKEKEVGDDVPTLQRARRTDREDSADGEALENQDKVGD